MKMRLHNNLICINCCSRRMRKVRIRDIIAYTVVVDFEYFKKFMLQLIFVVSFSYFIDFGFLNDEIFLYTILKFWPVPIT